MPNPFDKCIVCKTRYVLDDSKLCSTCKAGMEQNVTEIIDKAFDKTTGVQVLIEESKPSFNEPEHYHQHEMDTIEFLQKGFPPHVFMGFAIGHVIKYAQRAEYKNGREDFVKMVDYAKRALDWYDKTHS